MRRHALRSAPRLATRLRQAVLVMLLLPLGGCKIPFMGDDNAKAVEEGKAIGSACRHALRGIEDCYNHNPEADKPAVFAGWKEMDEYMRENKIEGKPTPPPQKETDAAEETDAPSDSKADSKSDGKKSKGK